MSAGDMAAPGSKLCAALGALARSPPGAVAASGVRSHRELFQNQLTDQLTADVVTQLLPIRGRHSGLGQ